jgi:hypothetical protein
MMRRLFTRLSLVLLAFTLLVSTPALAQSIPTAPTSKPSAADEATAKKSFESGLRLYGEGSYAEALIAFEQSYRLGGRASALKNIAQCHRNLKHFVEAYEAYEQMLAKHDAQITPVDKKAVQQALDELGVLTATVVVVVSEADAQLEIDGHNVGRSPMSKPKRLAATGGHTLRVSKAGFTHLEQPFTVDSQESKKIDVKLEVEKTVGHVVVREQNGRDVHVFIDGEDQGPAPWEGDLPAGEHVIEGKSARFSSDARKVVVAQRERLDLALDAAALQGRLRVTTVPASATIVVDGNTVGTGSWEGELPEGTHRIEVSLPGQTPQIREIALGRGQVIVQEIPIVSAIAMGKVPVYDGIYVRFSIFGQIGIGTQPDDSVAGRTTEDGSFDGAVGASLRGGRQWDWYGIEAVGLFMMEHREHKYRFPQISTGGAGGDLSFRDQSNAPNAFFGIGPRVTSKDDTVRFTFGIAPGLAVRTFQPRRNIENSGSGSGSNPGGNRFVQTTSQSTNSPPGEQSYSSAGYTSFGFVMDGGILLGNTPGAKFFLGAQAWVDFAPTLVTGPDTLVPIPNDAYKQPGRGITVVDGAQFYVGPVLGLQFGH